MLLFFTQFTTKKSIYKTYKHIKLLFYNMLINMVEKVIFQMEVNSIEFIDSIPEETN